MKKNKKIKIGVVDFKKKKLSSYRRRFLYFLNKKNFLIENAKIEKYYDYVFLNELADLSKWVKYDKSKIIFDLVNPYLLEKNFILKTFRGTFKFLVGDHKYLFFSYNKLLHAMISAGSNPMQVDNIAKQEFLCQFDLERVTDLYEGAIRETA